jgi:hypothetical protein
VALPFRKEGVLLPLAHNHWRRDFYRLRHGTGSEAR